MEAHGILGIMIEVTHGARNTPVKKGIEKDLAGRLVAFSFERGGFFFLRVSGTSSVSSTLLS